MEKDYEKLLGRKVISADKATLATCVNNKSILVTGAGGSIGTEICLQIARCHPHHIVLFERSEIALYSVENEIRELLGDRQDGAHIKIVPVLGSVRNKRLVEKTIQRYKVDTIYHAAAYKQVPMLEKNIIAGIQNNIFGTLVMARAAEKCQVKHFILVSTDKAVRPSSIMGATKRVAEQVLQAMNHRKSRTCFAMVRFGNVLGSSGSVLPLFRKQILSGGPVTVTHPRVSRFFMTTQEAASLVIHAGALARGGEVFILNMSSPIRIVDIAHKMIELMGRSVCQCLAADTCHCEDGIKISYTGLREGEKLTEELPGDLSVTGTPHGKILRAMEDFRPWQALEILLGRLEFACHDMDQVLAKEVLLEMVDMPTSGNLRLASQPDTGDYLIKDALDMEEGDLVTAVKH